MNNKIDKSQNRYAQYYKNETDYVSKIDAKKEIEKLILELKFGLCLHDCGFMGLI